MATTIDSTAQLYEQLYQTFSMLGQRIYGSEFGPEPSTQSVIPRRDLDVIFSRDTEIPFARYFRAYERGDISNTIIALPAQASWSKLPIIVRANEIPSLKDPFNIAFNRFATQTRLWPNIAQLDEFSGIGRYGVMLLGINDGKRLSEPVDDGFTSDSPFNFFRVYHEGEIDSIELETSTRSTRYGRPLMYKINLDENNPKTEVHASRILHVAEKSRDGIYGIPRLKAVWDQLHDLHKTVGGGAEANYQQIDRGRVFDISPDFTIDDDEKDEFESEIYQFVHGFRRYMLTRGVEIKDFGSAVVNPSYVFDAIIKLISATTRIPARTLLGSEAGQLASGQDKVSWSETILTRQLLHVEHNLLRPFIDMSIRFGALPQQEYDVLWPPIFNLTPVERSQALRGLAATAKIANEAPEIIDPQELKAAIARELLFFS